jgi:hypothetical protein
MVSEPSHGLGLAPNPRAACLVEPFGLYEGEGDIAVEALVPYQVDALLGTFTQEALYPVAT